MLNELYSLSGVIENKIGSAKDWHREYNMLPKVTQKSPCIRVWLFKDGSIRETENIKAELAQSLRKFGNNQGTFPAFNIVPLYRITDEEQIAELKNMEMENARIDLEKVSTWCTDDNWNDGLVKKVKRCLHDIPQSMMKVIADSEQPEKALFLELVRLAETFSDEPEKSFREALEKSIFTMLRKQENTTTALYMLFHKGNPKKKPKDDTGPSISIILDLFDWKQYGYPVACEHTTEWINKMLLLSKHSDDSITSDENEIDAFGLPFVNPDEPMSKVKLDGFEVILRSMFDGQPCQHRYGKINDGSYPIGNENRSLVKRSLEWIADSDREGITWQKVDREEIVFVYPSKFPEVPPKFASIFGSNRTDNSAQTEARFEQMAKEFIKVFKGIPSKEKPDLMQIFSILKLGRGRSKVVFTRNCPSDQFIQAAEDWESGCCNVPNIDLGEWRIPFPLHVARIVNNVWKQSGELAQGKNAVKQMKFYQGMELLLDIMQESMVCHYLHILLTNSSGLVNYLGNWVHGGSKRKDKLEENRLAYLKKETILLSSVLGLLLYKNHNRKEIYMESKAYLVGQLLKISDELHALYCNAVRNEGVPPQLAGSALFVTACDMPIQAIAQLSLRMNPYITWAKQYRFKDIKDKNKESWKAGWYLSLYEDVVNKLNLLITNPIRFGDIEKAQLFIGYLASFPKKESSAAGVANSNQNDNETGGSENE
jgi:hypothetical protein